MKKYGHLSQFGDGNFFSAGEDDVSVELSWTPTGSMVTNTTYTSKAYIQNGNYLWGEIKAAFAGAPDVGNITFEMPSGWEIDSRYSNGDLVGFGGSMYDASATSTVVTLGGLKVDSNTIQIYQLSTAGASGSPLTLFSGLSRTSPVTIAAGDYYIFKLGFFVTAV